MIKKANKIVRQEKMERFLVPAKRAKENSIHTLAQVGRQHKWLRYPMLAFLFVFLFVYNLILHLIRDAYVEKRFERATAVLLVFVLVLGSVPTFTLTAEASNDTLTIGAFNYATGKFDQATGSGDAKYASLSIDLTYLQGTISVSLPTVTGFTLSSSDSYSYKITLSNKTAGEIADYIKQIQFSGYKDYGVNISFLVMMEVPSFAKDVHYYAGNDHYYLFVPYSSTSDANNSWTNAYKAAKNLTYCGQTGYLATITSQEEEETIQAITGSKTGWLGGTRMKPTDDPSTGLYYSGFNTTTSTDLDYWYWACGPERGRKFFSKSKVSQTSFEAEAANNYYFNWNKGEPNADSGGAENCLTILHLDKGTGYITGGQNCWNDIVYDRHNGDGYCPNGYMVEFGSEENGFGGSTRLFASYDVQKHTHDWTYTEAADGKSISTTCATTFGTCTNGYNNNTYTLSIDAADTAYTGSAYDIANNLTITNTISGSPVTGCSISAVNYVGITTNGTNYGPSTTPPTKAGYYKAYIDIAGTRSVEFRSTDSDGNTTTSVTSATENYTIEDTFTITDNIPPHGNVKVGGVTFSDDNLITKLEPDKINFYSAVPTVSFNTWDTESGVVKKVQYFYTTGDSTKFSYTLADLQALKDTDWTTYYDLFGKVSATPFSLAFTKSIVYAKITDLFDNVTYISSDVIVVDENAVAAWYTVSDSGELTIQYGSLEQAVAAGNSASTGSTAVVVKPGATATSTAQAKGSVSIYVPEGTTVTVAGDTINNPAVGTQDSYVQVSSLNNNNTATTEAGNDVIINGKSYTNASAGTEEDNSTMLLSINSSDDKVVLTNGKIQLTNTEQIYVEKNNTQVLISNDSPSNIASSIIVSPAVNGSDNTLVVSNGSEVSINDGSTTSTYTSEENGTTIALKSTETTPVLTEGSVDVTNGSSVSLQNGSEYVTVTATGSSKPEVSASGDVEFNVNEVVKINGDEYTYTAAENNTTVNVTTGTGDNTTSNEATPVLESGSLVLGTDSVYVGNTTDGVTTYTKVNNEDTTVTVKPTVSADGSVSLTQNDSVKLTTYKAGGTTVENTVTADSDNTSAVTVSTSTNGSVTTAVGNGQSVTINDNEYKSISNDTTISSKSDEKTPELKTGQVEVAKDSTIQVQTAVVTTTGDDNATVSADGNIDLKEKSQITVKSTTSDETTVIKVDSLSGNDITVTAGDDGTVSVPLQNDDTVKINDNTYTGATASGAEGGSTEAVISVDLKKETATLTSGSVDLEKGSEINVKSTAEDGTVTTSTITAETNTQPTVNSDGSVDMPDNCIINAETLGTDTEISTMKTQSSGEGDTTKIQLSGTSVEVTLNENKEITVDGNDYTAKSNNTTIDIGSSGATLTSGSVELEKNDSINVNGTSVTNVGSEGSKLVVGMKEATEEGEESTAEIQVEQGESYKVVAEGQEEGYVFTNESGDGEETTTYEIDKEGNLILTGEDIPVTVGDDKLHIGSGTEGTSVTAKVTEEGVEVTAGAEDDIVITDESGNTSVYKNGGSGSDKWGITVKEDGGVYIDEGQVLPGSGSTISVEQPLGGGTSQKVYQIKNCGTDDSVLVDREVNGDEITNKVTLTQAGAKIELTDSSTTETYTALTDNTVLKLTNNAPILEAGGVELGSGSKVEIDNTGFKLKNAGAGTSTVSAERTTPQGTTTEVTKISISKDGVANLTDILSGDRNVGIQIKNNSGTESSYILQDDGTLSIESGSELSITGGSQGTVKVTPADNSKVEVKAVTDGVEVKIPEAGDSVTLNAGGTTSTLTAKSANVDLKVKDGDIILNNGQVELSQSSKVTVGTSGKTYTNAGDKPVDISIDNTTGKGTLTLSGGAKVSLGTSGNVAIKNLSDTDETTLAINADGTVTLGAGKAVSFDIKGNEFKVEADGDITVDETANGPKFTIPAGKTLTITDKNGVVHTYANNTDDPLVISLDKDGDVSLLQGSVSLANGESVYMTDVQGNKILVEASENSSIMIGADGAIVIPTGSTAVIGGNQYTGTTAAATGETGKARFEFSPTGGAPILVSGQVDVAPGSSIAKKVTVNGVEQIVEIKNTTSATEENNKISVGDNFVLDENQKATVTTGDKTYSLEVPENGGTAKVSLEAGSDEVKLGIDVTPEEGETTASLKINGGTYTADCSDGNGAVDTGEKLALTIDGSDGETRIDSDGVQALTVSNGTLVVGTSVIKTGATPVTIEKKDSGTPELTVPAGGQVEITKTDATEADTPTKISVPADATEPVTLAALSSGGLGVALKANETVEVNGGILKAAEEGTEIDLSGSTPELKAGSVDLGEDAVIKIGDSVITNQGDSEHAIKVAYVTKTVGGVETTVPQITVPAGGSYSVSKADSTGNIENTITYLNNGAGESKFELKSDGSMEIPAGTKVPVSINGGSPIEISGDGAVETKISDKGVELTTEDGKTIKVGDNSYKNVSDAALVLNNEGKVELTGGEVEINGNTSLVLDSNGTATEIKNTSSDSTKTVDIKKEADGKVTLGLSDGASTTVTCGGKEQTYTALEEGTSLSLDGDTMTLTQGQVALAPSTEVEVVNNSGAALVYSNGGSTGSVDVKKDSTGAITLGVEAGATINMAPKSDDAKFAVSLTNNGGSDKTYTVDSEGYITTGSNDKIAIKQSGKNNITISPSLLTTMKMKVTDTSVDIKLGENEKIDIAGVAGNAGGTGLKSTSVDTEVSITESGIELKNGGVEMTGGSKILVGHSDTNAGTAYESVGDGVKVTYDSATGTGSMTIPAGQGVKISTPGSDTGSYQLVNTSEENPTNLTVSKDGSLSLPAGQAVGLKFGTEEITIEAQASGQGVKFSSSAEGPKITVAAGETVKINGKEYKNTGSTELQFVINEKGEIILLSGEIEAPENETVYVKNESGETIKITAENGSAVVKRTVDASGKVTVNASVTSTAGKNAVLKINDATYESVPENSETATLSLSLDGTGNEVKLDSDSTGNFKVTNGSMTVGNTVVSTKGDMPVYIQRSSKIADPSVTVLPGGNVTLGDASTGKSVEIILPEDAEDNKKVSLDTKTGQLSVEMNAGESITIGGVEYTAGDEAGKLVVDNETGELNTLKSTITPEEKIDTKNFNKDNYSYTLADNEEVTVGTTEYKVSGGSAKLIGNANGNPIIQASAGTKITVGDKVYEAGSDGTKFIVGNDGTVTLLDNGKAENSSVKFTGLNATTVDGVTYQARGNASYTITYGADGDKVTVPSNTTMTVSLPANKTVYMADGKSVNAVGSGVTLSMNDKGVTGTGYTKLTAVKDAEGNVTGYLAKVEVPAAPAVTEDSGSDNSTKEKVAEETEALEEALTEESEEEDEEEGETAEAVITEDGVLQVTIEKISEAKEIEVTTPAAEITYGEGTVTLSSETDEGVLRGTVTELMKACFSEDELKAIHNGTNAQVVLSVELIKNESEIVTTPEQQIIDAVNVWKEDMTGLTYLDGYDVVLSRNFDDGDWEVMTQLPEAIKIEFTLEEGSPAIGKICYAIRNHDSDCTILEDQDDDDMKVTVLTDCFSTYALAYIDEEEPATAEAFEEAEGSAATEDEATEDAAEDVAPVEAEVPEDIFPWWILLLGAAVLVTGVVIVFVKKKKEEKED